MRTLSLLAACLTLAACTDALDPSRTPRGLTAAADTNGVYIVVFKDAGRPARTSAREITSRYRVQERYVFQDAIHAMSVKASPEAIAAVHESPEVAYIEKVTLGSVDDVANSWGLDQIDQRGGTRDGQFNPVNRGAGVNAYIIDTGIIPELSEWGGRASIAFDVFGGDGRDCHYHGDHVAGTVGGQNYGVANQVNLRAIRALDCGGHWTQENLLSALNWLAGHAVRPAVANISAGGFYNSQSITTALTNVVNAGVFVSASAGNETMDACNVSPGSVPAAFTVSAFDQNHVRPSWANWGNCVDLYAPGVGIVSIDQYGRIKVDTGTSMAAPHVTGVAASYLAEDPTLSPDAIATRLKANATKLMVSTGKPGTRDEVFSYIYEVEVLGDTVPYEGTSVTYTAIPHLMRPPYDIKWKNDLNQSQVYCTGATCTMYFAASYNDFLIDVDVVDALGRTARRRMWVDVQGGFNCAPGARSGALCSPPIARR